MESLGLHVEYWGTPLRVFYDWHQQGHAQGVEFSDRSVDLLVFVSYIPGADVEKIASFESFLKAGGAHLHLHFPWNAPFFLQSATSVLHDRRCSIFSFSTCRDYFSAAVNAKRLRSKLRLRSIIQSVSVVEFTPGMFPEFNITTTTSDWAK
eukprot:GGOE01003454.1.p1 GENE.GGOE01003454.1~~GGOE01003454.1.p1  ORF type:complete len:161 (-),score=14.62 GGOE01003454.1:263-715(-)